MNSRHPIDDHASALLDAAQALCDAAGRPGSSEGVPAALSYLEEALQALSAAFYQAAADAAPGIAERRRQVREPTQPWPPADPGLSREQQVRLMATLHDVAAAAARCARVCRGARPVAEQLIEHLQTSEPPATRVA